MRSLRNKPQVQAPTSTYPYGRIKDDDGSGVVGTPVDEQVYGDFHQFFQQLMVDGNLTPNELPENEYDGFQLNTALGNFILHFVNQYADGPWLTSSDLTSLGSGYADFGSPSFGFRLTKKGTCVQFRGGLQKTGALSNPDTVFTLPAAFRPAKDRIINAANQSGVTSPNSYTFQTSGVLLLYGTGTGVSIYFDGIEMPL